MVDHQSEHFIEICVDALCAGHAGIAAGRTDRTAKLCAEEPVEDRNQHEDEDGNDKDRIFIKYNAFKYNEARRADRTG